VCMRYISTVTNGLLVVSGLHPSYHENMAQRRAGNTPQAMRRFHA